ncbi:MAG TPA: class I SAM-dependent methyltransferase [Bryobacteraceae bacterium]|nr:class I SAM-dependent methyltransferase [Bryobacteraceae bacterium]
MIDPEVLEQMRGDWNSRAHEDARYYVAFGRRGQQDEEFFASAADVVRLLEQELKRLPREIPPEQRRALEVGCGPGRLMRPMSRNFGEIHGVDVSDEMIRLAEERFHGASRIHLHLTSGADLSPLVSGHFHFVYSYAVFQHIPSREVVLHYLDEIRRVLTRGGIARLHFNGLPPDSKAPNTWEGVRFSRQEIADYAREHDFQLLALEGAGTQYMWTTWRKQPAGWRASLKNTGSPAGVQRCGDAHTGEPAVPASGRFAYVSFWMEGLPADCDINDLRIGFDGQLGTVCYIGPTDAGLSQLNVLLPPRVRTGIVPVELQWLGKPLTKPVWLRIIPPAPAVPRLCSVSDATNLLAGRRIESGLVKLVLEDLPETEIVKAEVDGRPVADLERFSTDAMTGRFEVNFRLPADLARGSHNVHVLHGTRRFPPVAIEVV